jgi:hypothetical protein
VGTFIPIILQQFFVKGHLKNRFLTSLHFGTYIIHNQMIQDAYFFFEAYLLCLAYFSIIARRKPYAFADMRTTSI